VTDASYLSRLTAGSAAFAAAFIAVGLVVQVPVVRAAFLSFFANGSTSAAERGNDAQASYPNSQTLALLQAAHNIDPTPSRGGGDVKTEDGVALVAEATPFTSSAQDQMAPAAPDQISLYLVQDGDTLSQVAKMFGVSVNTIVWANELSSSNDIHPGETLLILPISGVQHTVEKGDTIASIAEKYHGNEEEILAYNGIEADALSVGATVTVPGGEIEEKQATYSGDSVAQASQRSISGYFIHPLPGAVRTQGIHGYNAVDYGAAVGTPIRAAADGRVIVSRVGGWNGGYGSYIVIDHPIIMVKTSFFF